MDIEELINISRDMTENYVIDKYFKVEDVETPLFDIQAWEAEQYYDDNNELWRAVIFLSTTITDNKIFEFIYDNRVRKIFFKEFQYREENSIGMDI